MSLSVTINPLSHELCMYGEASASSGYSLSGHVSVSVHSFSSFFEPRRTARLLLQSLSLTFEGQSEVFTPGTGYGGVRLCSIVHELVKRPIVLSNEGQEGNNEPCGWNFIFNLPIPGWLPASIALGGEDLGVRYGLYATAKFTNLDEHNGSSWSLASLFRSRVKTVEVSQNITLRRFFSHPGHDLLSEPTTLSYLVNTRHPENSSSVEPESGIPQDVLSKVQVLCSVPEYANMKDSSLPVTIRLRTKNLPEEECKRLQVTDISIDVVQQERYLREAMPGYRSQFPLPDKTQQPPNLPLRNAHPAASLFDVGLYTDFSASASRSFSLLPSPGSGSHALPSPNYPFATDSSDTRNAPPTWYTMETIIPIIHTSPAQCEAIDWAGAPTLRPSAITPLLSTEHSVEIALTCTYDLAAGGVAKEKLFFRVPVTIGLHAPVRAANDSQDAGQEPILPVYSELYDSNGERKVDLSIPLPLYTPKDESVSCETTLDASTPDETLDPELAQVASSLFDLIHDVPPYSKYSSTLLHHTGVPV